MKSIIILGSLTLVLIVHVVIGLYQYGNHKVSFSDNGTALSNVSFKFEGLDQNEYSFDENGSYDFGWSLSPKKEQHKITINLPEPKTLNITLSAHGKQDINIKGNTIFSKNTLFDLGWCSSIKSQVSASQKE